MSVPQPQFLQSREKEEDGGTRSPKYPSTVTKVRELSWLRLQISRQQSLSFCSLQVLVKPGDTVTKGQLLMTVEGMKMEVRENSAYCKRCVFCLVRGRQGIMYFAM